MSPRRSVLNPLCFPHLLPQSPKAGARKRRWGNRLYCHTNAVLAWQTILSCKCCSCCPFSKGEMLSVFFILCFLCLGRCLCRFFAVLLFLGSLCEKMFRERTFVFGCRWLVLGVLVVFCLGFCFIFWRLAPENVRKNSLHVRSSVFWVCFSLSSVFRRRRLFRFCFCCFFSRETAQG